jgi:hypothetical protein
VNRRLWLGSWAASRNYLNVSYGVDELRFATTLWYEEVDFHALRDRYGADALERLVFHIAAFEANTLCSLRPDVFDLGPFEHCYTPAFDDLWTTVAEKVWAEWRYRHDAPGLRPPAILGRAAGRPPAPISVPEGDVDSLLFCGGGKDSLVMMRLLEAAEVPYASLAYAHSVYGRLDVQHELIGGLLAHGRGVRAHRLWVINDALGSPVQHLHPEFQASTMTAAETPASLFGVLPLALAHGYRDLLVGHERSADVGNLIWDATGEEVNHQWGKSLDAERMLSAYVREHLLDNVNYASPLKPINDVVIFTMLDAEDPAVASTHSCNEHKPWCRRCAKCAYVWLGYVANLPPATVAAIFEHDLFDVEANQLWFRQLLGMEAHTPFECVGGIDESRLFFEMCARRGAGGRAIEAYRAARLPLPDAARIADLCAARLDNHALPAELHARVAPLLQAAAERAHAHVAPLAGVPVPA